MSEKKTYQMYENGPYRMYEVDRGTPGNASDGSGGTKYTNREA